MPNETLRTIFTADITDLQKKLGLATNSLAKFGKAATRLGAVLVASLATQIAAVSTAAFIGVQKLGKYADRILDLRQITGLTTDQLQEFENVARVAGVSTEALAAATEGLTRRLRVAGSQDKTFTDNVKALGVQITDTNGRMRATSDLVPEIIDRLAAMQDITTRNSIGMQLFGRRWSELAPVMSLGAKGIEEAKKQAHEMGQVLSTEALNAANNFRISLEQLRARVELAWREILVNLVPAFQAFVNVITNTVLPAVEKGARLLGEYIAGIFEAFANPLDNLGNLDSRLKPLFEAIVKVKAAWDIVTTTVDLLGVKINLLPYTVADALKQVAETIRRAPNPVLKFLGIPSGEAQWDPNGGGNTAGSGSGGRTGSSFKNEQLSALAEIQARLDAATFNFMFPAEAAAQMGATVGAAVTNAVNGDGSASSAAAALLQVADDANAAATALGETAKAARDSAAELDAAILARRRGQEAARLGVNQGEPGVAARPIGVPQPRVNLPDPVQLVQPAVSASVDRAAWRTMAYAREHLGRRLGELGQRILDGVVQNVAMAIAGVRRGTINDFTARQAAERAAARANALTRQVVAEQLRFATSEQLDAYTEQAMRKTLAVGGVIHGDPIAADPALTAKFKRAITNIRNVVVDAALSFVPALQDLWRRGMNSGVGTDKGALFDFVFGANQGNGPFGPQPATPAAPQDYLHGKEMQSAADAFSNAALQLANQIPILGNALTAFITGGPFAALAAFISDLLGRTEGLQKIITMVTDAFQPLVAAVDSILQAIMPLLEPLLQLNVVLAPFVELVALLLAPAMKLLGFIVKGLAEIITGVVNVLVDIYNFLLGWLFGKLGHVGGGAKTPPDGTSDAGIFGAPSGNSYTPSVGLSIGASPAAPAVSRPTLDAARLFYDGAQLVNRTGVDLRHMGTDLRAALDQLTTVLNRDPYARANALRE